MHLPNSLRYGEQEDPFHIEFDRRTGHYSMDRHHIHHNYEIYYLFSGERGYFIKDRSYSIRRGDLVILNSNEVHKTFDIGVPDHERVLAYYDSVFFERFYPDDAGWMLALFQGHPVIRLNIKERMLIEALFTTFFEELIDKPVGFELRLRHLAAELLMYVLRFTKKTSVSPSEQDTPTKQKITEIVRHINNNYDQSINLNGISQNFYISPSYLSRIFKDVTGFSFTDYVNIVRVKEAQRLLRETDWKIIEISIHTGFDNFSHFGKVFKHVASLSPRDYRRQHR